eukprot:7383562-Prymnesium_polylepis.3
MSGIFSWAETTEAEHEAGKGVMASNNPAARGHGLTRRQLQVFGRIGIGNAGAVSQAIANGDLDRSERYDRGSRRKGHAESKCGAFFKLPEEMREALLLVSLVDGLKVQP